jgi:hypothetical protein
MKFGEIKIHGEPPTGGFGFQQGMPDEKVH